MSRHLTPVLSMLNFRGNGISRPKLSRRDRCACCQLSRHLTPVLSMLNFRGNGISRPKLSRRDRCACCQLSHDALHVKPNIRRMAGLRVCRTLPGSNGIIRVHFFPPYAVLSFLTRLWTAVFLTRQRSALLLHAFCAFFDLRLFPWHNSWQKLPTERVWTLSPAASKIRYLNADPNCLH